MQNTCTPTPNSDGLLKKWLEIIVAFLTIISVMGIGFGELSLFIYAKSIGHRELFVQSLNSIGVLSFITILFSLKVLYLLLSFAIPHFVAMQSKPEHFLLHKQSNQQDFSNPFILFFIVPNFGFIILAYAICIDKENTSIFGLISGIAIFIYVAFLLYGSIKKICALGFSKWLNNFTATMPYIVVGNLLTVSMTYSLSSEWNDRIKEQFIFVVSMIVMACVNAFIASFPLYNKVNLQLRNSIVFCFLFTIVILIGASAYSTAFNKSLLQPLGLVESPKHSKWYLISKEFIDKNQLSPNNLVKIKNTFSCPNNQVASSCASNNQTNALYGYFAWNVGNTKLLCPYTTDKNHPTGLCITIDAVHIQPLNINQYN